MREVEDQERREAVRRGLEYMYRAASDGDNLAAYGHDFLFCFDSIASTSRDRGLRSAALGMGRRLARQWLRGHTPAQSDATADQITHLVFGYDAAARLGVPVEPRLRRRLRAEAARHVAQDFFWFDPASEPPPDDVPEDCGCGATGRRGSRRCAECGARLDALLGRYGVMTVALIRAYLGRRYGVRLGASYAEVFEWLPFLRPYRGREGGANPDFYWTAYCVTHVVYTLNDYGARRLSPRWLPDEYEFLKANLDEAVALRDPEMTGEFLDSLKAFGLDHDHPLLRRGTRYVLSEQNGDGGWGDPDAKDIYNRYHPTFTAINGLRDYAWRGGWLRDGRLRLLKGGAGCPRAGESG